MKAKSLKLKLIVLYVFSLVFTFTEINAQNCSSLSGVINTYAPVTAISGNVVTQNIGCYYVNTQKVIQIAKIYQMML